MCESFYFFQQPKDTKVQVKRQRKERERESERDRVFVFEYSEFKHAIFCSVENVKTNWPWMSEWRENCVFCIFVAMN